MKPYTILTIILLAALCSACAPASDPGAQNAGSETNLLISGGDSSTSYTRSDLEAMPASQAAFNGVTYQGVTVTALIQEAGFDPANVRAIKAIAADGFSVNYDPSQVLTDDVIVAYARADGGLADDDGAFRMVLPGAEGKLNVRMLVELQVVQ